MKKGVIVLLVLGLFLMVFMIGGVKADTGYKNKIEKFLNENGYVVGLDIRNSTTEDGVNIKETSIKRIQNRAFSIVSTTSNELTNSNSEGTLVVLEKNGEKRYFIAETYNQGNSNMLKMYNEEEEVILDLTNQKIVSTYGNEKKCGFLTCMGNYIIKNIGAFGVCLPLCSGADFTFTTCAGCLGLAGARGLWDCTWNSCAWYKCRKNCENKFGFGDYETYCFEGNVWKQRALFQYQCPADINYGESGTCEINSDSGKWINQTKVMTCQYGCENSVCNGAPVCNLISPINNLTTQNKSIIIKFETLDKLKNIQMIDYSEKRPKLSKLCTNCKKDYTKKKIFTKGIHNITFVCTDLNGKTQNQSIIFQVNNKKI